MSRRIAVVKPDYVSFFNQLSEAYGYGAPLDIGLRVTGDETNTIVAYWCSWNMDEATETLIRETLIANGMTAEAVAVIPPLGDVPVSWQFLFFNGDGLDFPVLPENGWSPERVLAALNLDRLAVE